MIYFENSVLYQSQSRHSTVKIKKKKKRKTFENILLPYAFLYILIQKSFSKLKRGNLSLHLTHYFYA